jgi:hypothetical protein
MATYLEGGVDFIPPVIPFQPNYNLILSTLQYRQGQYDQGFAQLKSSANSVIGAQLLNETNIEKRKQILANAESALKSLPTVDLSLPQNVAAAKNVFRPFYEDNDILLDMKETKSYMNERSKGLALRDSDKEEQRNRYWNVGIQDLDDWAEEFSKATPDQLRNMRSRRYVGKPQIGEKVIEMFNQGKLKREVDTITGQVKITDTNGKEIITPLTNLYLSLAQNDPEALEAYNVFGRVKRNQYIRDNESRFGSRDAAAAEHDRLLVADFKASNAADLKETADALNLVNARIAKWKERGVENLTDEEAQRYARDIADAKSLTQSKTYYEKADATASNNILGNPTAYLGQVYLSKSARDIAKALSAFGTRKIDTNPIYKDLVLPFKLEEFKTNEDLRVKAVEHIYKKDEIKYTAEMKALYGDKDGDSDGDGGDGSSKGSGGLGAKTGSGGLNIPVVQDNPAGAGVKNRTEDGLPDAYADYRDSKNQVLTRTVDAKISFIDNVLSANEMVDSKGRVLDQNQKQNLAKDGKLLDMLVKKAESKVNIMVETKDPQRFNALSLKKKVDQNMNLWRAMDSWATDINKQLVGNLEGSNKEDGWVFKHIVSNGSNIRTDNDVAGFEKSLRSDPAFKAKVDAQLIEEQKKQDRQSKAWNVPTSPVNRAAVEQRVLKNITDDYQDYRNTLVKSFNTQNAGGGFSFIGQYDPLGGKGGGGINARQLQFIGRSSIAGEQADVITLDLLSKITGSEGDKDVVYAQGPDSPEGKAVQTDGDTDQDDDVKRLMNTVIKPNLIASVKAGKDAPMKYYSISSSMVASNNPNYHVYTFTFDPDYLNGLVETDSKPGLLENNEARMLKNGVSIYIKKDLDKSQISQRSGIGEIEMLLNTRNNGVLEETVAPGYDMRIEKMIQGGYKMITSYPVYNADNPNGKIVTKTMTLPADTDLSYMYYSTIARMSGLYEQVEAAQDNTIKNTPNRKKYTQAEIDEMAAQLGQQGN